MISAVFWRDLCVESQSLGLLLSGNWLLFTCRRMPKGILALLCVSHRVDGLRSKNLISSCKPFLRSCGLFRPRSRKLEARNHGDINQFVLEKSRQIIAGT